MCLFNTYLPGGKHESRRAKEISEVYKSVTDEAVPESRYYLKLQIGGEVIGAGKDLSMPTIKYVFKSHWEQIEN